MSVTVPTCSLLPQHHHQAAAIQGAHGVPGIHRCMAHMRPAVVSGVEKPDGAGQPAAVVLAAHHQHGICTKQG